MSLLLSVSVSLSLCLSVSLLLSVPLSISGHLDIGDIKGLLGLPGNRCLARDRLALGRLKLEISNIIFVQVVCRTYLKGFHHRRAHPSGDVATGEDFLSVIQSKCHWWPLHQLLFWIKTTRIRRIFHKISDFCQIANWRSYICWI